MGRALACNRHLEVTFGGVGVGVFGLYAIVVVLTDAMSVGMQQLMCSESDLDWGVGRPTHILDLTYIPRTLNTGTCINCL